jgi:hypothetical protein
MKDKLLYDAMAAHVAVNDDVSVQQLINKQWSYIMNLSSEDMQSQQLMADATVRVILAALVTNGGELAQRLLPTNADRVALSQIIGRALITYRTMTAKSTIGSKVVQEIVASHRNYGDIEA